MKKADFVQLVAQKSGLTKKDASMVIDAITDSIQEALVKGDGVSFIGFGSFTTIEKAAREGKVPGTNKTYKTPATKAVKFKVGKTLKEAIEAKKACKSGKCSTKKK